MSVPPPAEPDQGQVEVAHEALIRRWPRLRGWLAMDRADLRLRQEVGEAAAAWAQHGQDESFLLRGRRLEDAAALARGTRLALNTRERAYLAASESLREREAAEPEAQRERELAAAQRLAAEQARRAEEQAAAARRLRRRLYASAALGALALLAAAGALYGFERASTQADRAESEAAVRGTAEANANAIADRAATQQAIAEHEAMVARSRQLAAQADAQVGTQLDLALLLSLEALNAADTVEARSGLLTGLLAQPQLTTFLTGHSVDVESVAFSPDGATLATGSSDGTVILWDVASRRPLGDPLAGTDWVRSVAFSPDGATLAAGTASSDGGAVTLWGVASRQPLGTLASSNQVNSVAFSPDGKTLAANGGVQAVNMWDVDLASWESGACARANRNLSQTEWTRYLGTEPYRPTCPDRPPGEGAPGDATPVESPFASLPDRSELTQ